MEGNETEGILLLLSFLQQFVLGILAQRMPWACITASRSAASCRVLPTLGLAIIAAVNGAVDRGENGIVRAVDRARKT